MALSLPRSCSRGDNVVGTRRPSCGDEALWCLRELGIDAPPQLRLGELDITDALACRDVQAVNAVNYPAPGVSYGHGASLRCFQGPPALPIRAPDEPRTYSQRTYRS